LIETKQKLIGEIKNFIKAENVNRAGTEHSGIINEAYKIRCVEEGFLKAFSKGLLNGTVHTCVGQELAATSICSQLATSDWVTSNHRCHGHFISKTSNWKGLIDELLGLETGVCKGIGSSQHLFAPGFLSNGPQGALLPVGTGMAHKLKETGNIVVSFMGEGTLGEGITYEALNLASLLQVPQIFVCENNFYSQSTQQHDNTAGSIDKRFEAFGVKVLVGNTWDFEELIKQARQAIEYARNNKKPVGLIVHTYRLNAHSKGDDDRDPSEIEFFKQNDILNILQGNQKLSSTFKNIEREVDEYFNIAFKGKNWSFSEYRGDQLPRETSSQHLPLTGFDGRVIDRINLFLTNVVENGAIILGEDIASPYGGAFKATKDISEKYPKGILSTPISEAGLVGLASGHALLGGQAFAEIMFGDFVTYAFDQIVNGISKYHHMYGKNVSCPVTIRMPMGGKRGYGPTHSQSLEKFLCGIDNLLVVALNSIEDPFKTLQEASEQDCPKIIIENKVDYGRRAYNTPHPNLEITKAQTSLGEVYISPKYNQCHFSIITYGENVRVILDNYEDIAEKTNSIFDIFCLIKLNPLDLAEIAKSISKVKKVLIVDDGSTNYGISAEIIANLFENGFRGDFKRIGAEPVPIPSPKNLENQSLVNVRSIITAILELLDE
jgi:2-oxoisovalerate dehydrogenase E1 component